MSINLDKVSPKNMKNVGKNLKGLRERCAELGVQLTREQKAQQWRTLVEWEAGYEEWQKAHPNQEA